MIYWICVILCLFVYIYIINIQCSSDLISWMIHQPWDGFSDSATVQLKMIGENDGKFIPNDALFS